MTAPLASWCAPTSFVDSDHPDVVAFAKDVCAGATTDVARGERALPRRTRAASLRYGAADVSEANATFET
jgi:hypothetical protein